MRLEDIKEGTMIRGITSNIVTIKHVECVSDGIINIIFKDTKGNIGDQVLYRDQESRLEIIKESNLWKFDGDGALFRLTSEAHRISLAYLFDPLLAVHTSNITPLPHQITAVYEKMLPRQPLRFLLADDPGAGKTIMAGLLIKELMAREDVHRCLIVCPGNLVDQWQDELSDRFHLQFEILTKDKLNTDNAGKWFVKNNLIIARMDMLSRNDNIQTMLEDPDAGWDLIVCDEAHKMSASYFSGDIKQTKRYRLGRKLSSLTRHFLLMTATPHNGKEDDFQLFMALIDEDRFEGKPRNSHNKKDISDMMRRVIKEDLKKFDETNLFPKREAKTVKYPLSDMEKELYKEVTKYVQKEYNRAEQLDNTRARNIGFALIILQRRLASSPESIYRSLHRRHMKLNEKLESWKQNPTVSMIQRDDDNHISQLYDEEYQDMLDEMDDQEIQDTENKILSRTTAARTIKELYAEIQTLDRLEKLAYAVLQGGDDRKWNEMVNTIPDIFTSDTNNNATDVSQKNEYADSDDKPTKFNTTHVQKLVIFTEYRDTLSYLAKNIRAKLGQNAVVTIKGGMSNQERKKAQEDFKHDPRVAVLVATDAAGEGINLQNAHLMVNYDLPWNPNRIEQRFGRIHRIGQTKDCFLWNLVAEDTREGDVYFTLLEKLEQVQKDLGGRVFDVLGKIIFDGRPLRDLLVDAIRKGEKPEVKKNLTKAINETVEHKKIKSLLKDALATDVIEKEQLRKIGNDMERASARKLQPYYIESFFLEAFKNLGGKISQQKAPYHHITFVPENIRERARRLTLGYVQRQYQQVVFQKHTDSMIHESVEMEFIRPGHPLLDATLDITLERYRGILQQGTVLVDENNNTNTPRMIFYIEHTVCDDSPTKTNERRIISKRMLYVEMDSDNNIHEIHYAPYLDYRPLRSDEPSATEILKQPTCSWISKELDTKIERYAADNIGRQHRLDVSKSRKEMIAKTRQAVKERLTNEINFMRHRAEQLRAQEQTGKSDMRLSSSNAERRANKLQVRLDERMNKLDLEETISSILPTIIGRALVVPYRMLHTTNQKEMSKAFKDTQSIAARARQIVMDEERKLGREPIDREHEKIGYDIESREPDTGRLRFIEVKGRDQDANTITVTRNEILYSLNNPDNFILAIVEFKRNGEHDIHYVHHPFRNKPDFGVTSINYSFTKLLEDSEEPR